ncbi:MAG: hypothetical protein E7170_01985 [Firmicutes bacterium]|nr:hypothetical protein [Bacillota bacterium]
MKKYLKLFLIMSLFICGCDNKVADDNQNDATNNTNDNQVITEKIEGSLKKSNDFTYSLNVKNNKIGNEVTYKLNDEYTVKLIYVTNKYNEQGFNLYVNDTFVLFDYTMEDTVKFYTLADNLIYLNTGFTDVRCESVYIINDKNVTELYELDSIKGMVPYEIKINKDSIVINATRLSHGPSIVYEKYDTLEILVEDKETWKQAGITEDTIIEATYTYNVKNNKLNMTPTITNKISLKNYEEKNDY